MGLCSSSMASARRVREEGEDEGRGDGDGRGIVACRKRTDSTLIDDGEGTAFRLRRWASAPPPRLPFAALVTTMPPLRRGRRRGRRAAVAAAGRGIVACGKRADFSFYKDFEGGWWMGGQSRCSSPSTGPMLKGLKGGGSWKEFQSQEVILEAGVQNGGVEMIIGTETIEAKAGAEVGRGMNEIDTEIEVIVAIADFAVLALILTGNMADTAHL